MALNIFPRRPASAVPALESEPEPTELPEPSSDALDEPRKRTRRGSRGGRGRTRAEESVDGVSENGDDATDAAVADEPAAAPARRAPRSRAATPPLDAAEVVAEPAPQVAAPRARRPRGRAAEADAEAANVVESQPSDEASAAPPRTATPRPAAPVRSAPAPAERPAPGGADTASILRAIEAQGRQIENLVRSQEDSHRRGGGSNQSAAPINARPARVGIFVDAANIELACDRLRARFDWRKVLEMLTQNRQLVRAVAYSPVHDDPGVSMETQRFAEPFLGRGYKVVTKALKRFADGSVKANVDIELALDVVSMLDRLDVVCLVSGDGDFQPLVEYVQRRGVRCEVVSVSASTAGQLRNAADEFIDLGSRLKEIRAEGR